MTLDLIIARIRRALFLDEQVFEEVRNDNTFTLASALCAGAAVLLAAIGAWLFGNTVLNITPDGWFVDTFILGTIFTAALFAIGVGVIYLLLAQLYGEEVAPDGLIRVLGLTHLPFGVGLFVFVPEFGFGFGILSVAAMFYYSIFGLRAAYPMIDPFRVMVSVLVGFAVWAIVLPLISDFPDNNWVTGVFVYSLVE